jgi:hypothetical protein
MCVFQRKTGFHSPEVGVKLNLHVTNRIGYSFNFAEASSTARVETEENTMETFREECALSAKADT